MSKKQIEVSHETIRENMYYDPNKTLSRQRLFNFVVGARGIGKTYGCKKHVIKQFLRTGKQFVYIRRFETEMPSAEMRNFFDDIAVEFPDNEFKAGRGVFTIDTQLAGWYIALSKATMLKSVPFPNVGLIIFDEFIIETGVYHYLPNEVRTFLECYSTISRDRDVPVLFLSNAITMTNPYFLYFKLNFEQGQTVKLTKFISLELLQSKSYEEHVKSTKFGQLIAETDYGKYNISNQFLLDSSSFIQTMPPGANYICTFNVNQKQFGFYVSTEETLWYLSDKIDKTCNLVYALNFQEHDQNTMLAQRSNPYVYQMIDKYCQGNLRFTNQEVKNILSEILRKLI